VTPGRLDSAQGLTNATARIAGSIEPARDLWPAIEAQLEPRRRACRSSLAVAGGCRIVLVLLVAGSSLITANLAASRGQRRGAAAAGKRQVNLRGRHFGPGQTLEP